MKNILLLFLFVVLSSNLSAYSKKIILASFATHDRAQKMKNSLPERTPTLYNMTKRYDFGFVVRKAGKYYMLSAEVFTNEKALSIVYKEAKKRFKGSYFNDQTSALKKKKQQSFEVEAPKVEILAPKEMIVIRRQFKKHVEVVEQNSSKIEEKNDTIAVVEKNDTIVVVEKIKPVQITIKKESSFLDFFHWSYLVLIIIGVLLIYYFIKFKKIYDEY